MKRTALLILLLLATLPLRAQFFLNGDDPGHLRWFTIETPHYQLIYPTGTDSLARTYGRLLEQFRVPLGRSYGQIPGEGQHRKMPIVLHPYHPYPNGSVGWAPTRFDLYTLPDGGGSDPAPWAIQLASHEPRHQAQLQREGRKYFKLFNILSGQAWNPVAYQLFLGQALGEGDAVTAETGLWKGSRARTADFLNYYQVALDQDDYRNWFRWRYGSYKRFTPSYYALGYLTVAGSRYLTSDPMIMDQTAELARKQPWFLSASFRRTLKNKERRFDDTFRQIQDSVKVHFRADAAARAPFQKMEQLTASKGFPVDYHSPQLDANGTLFALREGHLHSSEIVAVKYGKVRHVMYVNAANVSLFYEPVKNRLYFTETRQDPRWKLSGSSVVCYYDINTGKAHDLATGHYYYNPQPHDNGNCLATAEYRPNGETHVVLLSTEDGRPMRDTRAPDGIQVSEFGWDGDTLYLCGISEGGYGIYRITPEGRWEEVLAPSVQKVVNMGNGDGFVEWVSDRSGVNEVYRYRTDSGRLLQMTHTRYGATDPCADDKYLYIVSQTLDGTMIFRTPQDSLRVSEVDYADVHSYFLADAVTAQEQALGPAPDLSSAIPVSAPKRYGKLAHPLRLHSWLPLYVNYDAVKEGSMDLSYNTASLGLSGYFQNTLGTVSGMLGYGLHPSPDDRTHWRNALHAKLVYSGQYPVFEASLDLGDRAARQYYISHYQQGPFVTDFTARSFLRDAPLLQASLKVYVPLSLRRYGVTYGVVPQLRYTFSNSALAPDPVLWKAPLHPSGLRTRYRLANVGSDLGNTFMQRLSASVRGYAMLAKAENDIYPKWGIGAELGASMRPGLQQLFAPNVYAYLYGYVPGLYRTQGLRLSAMVQQQLRQEGYVFGELTAGILPRGFDDEIGAVVARAFPFQWKVTADYAIPIYVGDISIPGIAYIKNFELVPHGDYTGFKGGNLWSVGADLTASMAKLILPFDSSLGVSFSWLGGSWYKNSGQERPWSLELIFSMSL